MNSELYEKITQKKEFSQLPRRDVELAIEKFGKKNLNEWQMIKLTRQFLRKIYSSFSSRKVFSESRKDKTPEWYLMKHKSSKERFPHYKDVYEKIFPKTGKFSLIDLGAGINGLSLLDSNYKKRINYIGIEAIGQFVDLMNEFFEKNKFNGKAFQESLFDLEKIKKIIAKQEKPRIVLLFKVIDSLESVQRNYSKELIQSIVPLSDKIIVSFATRSLGNRRKFSAQRSWLLKFITENFDVLDEFELGGEKYISFAERKHL